MECFVRFVSGCLRLAPFLQMGTVDYCCCIQQIPLPAVGAMARGTQDGGMQTRRPVVGVRSVPRGITAQHAAPGATETAAAAFQVCFQQCVKVVTGLRLSVGRACFSCSRQNSTVPPLALHCSCTVARKFCTDTALSPQACRFLHSSSQPWYPSQTCQKMYTVPTLFPRFFGLLVCPLCCT